MTNTVNFGYNGHLETGKICPLYPIVRYNRVRFRSRNTHEIFITKIWIGQFCLL